MWGKWNTVSRTECARLDMEMSFSISGTRVRLKKWKFPLLTSTLPWGKQHVLQVLPPWCSYQYTTLQAMEPDSRGLIVLRSGTKINPSSLVFSGMKSVNNRKLIPEKWGCGWNFTWWCGSETFRTGLWEESRK
jgi:hypothetical protein